MCSKGQQVAVGVGVDTGSGCEFIWDVYSKQCWCTTLTCVECRLTNIIQNEKPKKKPTWASDKQSSISIQCSSGTWNTNNYTGIKTCWPSTPPPFLFMGPVHSLHSPGRVSLWGVNLNGMETVTSHHVHTHRGLLLDWKIFCSPLPWKENHQYHLLP